MKPVEYKPKMSATQHKIYTKQLIAEIILSGSYLSRLWTMIIILNLILIRLTIRSCGQKINFRGCQWVVLFLTGITLISTRRLNMLLFVLVCLLMVLTIMFFICLLTVCIVILSYS